MMRCLENKASLNLYIIHIHEHFFCDSKTANREGLKTYNHDSPDFQANFIFHYGILVYRRGQIN